MSKEQVLIDKKVFLSLRLDSEKLNRLDAGGVDNWDWYGESLNDRDYNDGEDFLEAKERITKEVADLPNHYCGEEL